jgi:hypothetical protein
MIINKITNFNFSQQKLLVEPCKSLTVQMSPDVQLTRRRIFRNHDIINSTPIFGDRIKQSKTSEATNHAYFGVFDQLADSHTQAISEEESIDSKILGINTELRHLVSKNSSRTPHTKYTNPLKFRQFDEANLSHRDEVSEYSDEDLRFLDSCFDKISYAPNGRLQLSPSIDNR